LCLRGYRARVIGRGTAVAGLVLALTACSGSATGTAPPPVAAATTSPAAPKGETVWLCRPGMAANPCEGNLDATVVSPGGARTTQKFVPADDPDVDCFYVYPTVSTATTRNAPRKATAAEIATVRAQAARFASVCSLWAPVYRQVTLRGLSTGGLTDPKARALAHGDVVAAWHEYLAANPNRRFVLIGHSQGAFELTQLLQEEIDGVPALRDRLVSALLIGGFVSVDPGGTTGDLKNIPACRSATRTRCVVAYNSYAGTPPAGAVFGSVGSGRRVLCTNPAALGGGEGDLLPYLPAAEVPGAGSAGFVASPGQLRARCRTAGGRTWLDVTGTTAQARSLLAGAGSARPTWGLHRADVSLALGNLVDLVRTQTS
jgi:pimeloyl-ACP methyl ester carboxylesterase